MSRQNLTDSYRSALSFLFDRIDYERTATIPKGSEGLKLERMLRLLELVGNPQDQLNCVHIAGTKGKGSTAHFLASVLTRAGLKTGLFTSPHLERLEERFTVDGRLCTEVQLVSLVERLRPAAEQLAGEQQDGGPTFFELTTAMAMLYFRDEAVDIAVLEVGLGGRLDSTNVCQPLVTLITSISLDHTKQLGDTLAKIAAEKAGIIKPGIPVVSGVQDEEPRAVIRSIAEQNDAPLWELGQHFEVTPTETLRGSAEGLCQVFDFHNRADPARSVDKVTLGQLGHHQSANASLAIQTVQLLQDRGYLIETPALRDGLAQVRLPGRIEIAGSEPTVLIDTAHNTASIEALLQVVEECFPEPTRIGVFAATREKDIPGMLSRFVPRFDHVILTRYVKNPRSESPERLAELCAELQLKTRLHLPVELAEDPQQAVQKATERAGSQDLVCIAGSFFLAAEVKRGRGSFPMEKTPDPFLHR